ncbi:MAG TPA: SBBP repeat-containing protein [Bryobacteraceae bacterium]
MLRVFQAVLVILAISLPLAADEAPRVEFSRYLAAVPDASVVGVATDAAGNIFLAGTVRGPGFPLVRPLQTHGVIFLAKLDPSGTNLLYSTLLGSGSAAADSVSGLAVDAAGDAYIVGSTSSADFPTVNAVQRNLKGGADIYVMKIDPTGQRIIYSTFLGGSANDTAMSVSVGANGCAYVAGSTESADFPVTAGAFLEQPAVPGLFAVKLAPDGMQLLYSTYLGKAPFAQVRVAVTNIDEAALLVSGASESYIAKLNAAGTRLVYKKAPPAGATLTALATDPLGFVWAAGYSYGGTPVTANAAQSRPGGSAYYRSDDGGSAWSAGAGGLDVSAVTQFATDPTGRLYAATPQGLYRSDDTGRQWLRVLEDAVLRIAIDPNAPGTFYVLRSGPAPMAKTTDGGDTWETLPWAGPSPVNALATDPRIPGRIYAGTNRVYRSDDGGETWSPGPDLQGAGISAVAVDASDSSIVYASVAPIPGAGGLGPSIPIGGGLYRSTDGGQSFTHVIGAGSIITFAAIAPDPASPGTVYAAGPALLKSTDFGQHWTSTTAPARGSFYTALSVNENGALEVLALDGTIFRSEDGGATFSPAGGLALYSAQTFLRLGDTLLLGGVVGNDVFVTCLDLSGDPTYATYWGGRLGDSVQVVTVDADGNAYVAGSTSSPDFPIRGGVAPFGGSSDEFVLKFATDGTLDYAVTWGGNSQDILTAASAGPGGQVVFAGVTFSPDFPVTNGSTGPSNGASMTVTALR